MKNRLLAAFICISMIVSSMPVHTVQAKDGMVSGEVAIDAESSTFSEESCPEEREALSAMDVDPENPVIADEDSGSDDDTISGNDGGDGTVGGDNGVNDDDGNDNGGNDDGGDDNGSGDTGSDDGCVSDDSGDSNPDDDSDDADHADADAGNREDENGDAAEEDIDADSGMTGEADAAETGAADSMEFESDEELAAVAATSGGRKIEALQISTTYSKATVTATISGSDWMWINLFYHDKSDTGSWTRRSDVADVADYQYEESLQNLKADTEYEYVIILTDELISNPQEAQESDVRESGAFRTKKCEYAVEFVQKDTAASYREAVLSVTGKNITDLDVIKLTVTLNNGIKQQATLRKAQGFQKDVTFTGLAGGTKYTVTQAVFTVRENGRDMEMPALKEADAVYYEFTTAEGGEAPVSIALSEEKIGLNALYCHYTSNFEGFNTKKLMAVAEPAVEAPSELKWESSNTNVATVNAAGEVRVKGVGTATITVSSVYDAAVKASCEVTASKYAVGDKGKYSFILPLKNYGEKITLFKGESVERYLYCEMDAENDCTALSGDCNVTFSNPAIASWSGGRLTGKSVGTTDVIFEKDGVRAIVTLKVIAEGKNFAITDVKPRTADKRYAVKEGEDRYLLAYSASDAGINSYRASVQISPGGYSNREDFEWTTSNPTVAEVDATGLITVKGAGTTELTIKPKKYHTIDDVPYEQESAKVTLTVKALPPQKEAALYALVNTVSKLKDVSFPESWGEGWSWRYPETPLVTNGTYTGEYEFEAIYSGDDYYQDERMVSVKIGRITSIDVSQSWGTIPRHHVLEVSENPQTADWLSLEVTPGYQGYEPPADEMYYVVEIPDVQGLEIQKNAVGVYAVRALKKGNYTLKPVIKTPGPNGKVLAKTTYPIKAVTENQASSMRFKDENRYLTMDQNGEFSLGFDVTENKTDFILQAEVTDRNGNPVNTPLTWKIADQKVAVAAPTSKTDTHAAKVTIKGSGHVAIMVQAKDTAAVKAKINLEVRDHTPRIDKNKLTVNKAYDYKNAVGKRFAVEAGGTVEIVPVYGESVRKVELRERDSTQAAQFTIENYERQQYLIRPATDLATGTYNCDVYVETNGQTTAGKTASYLYPLKITVTDKAPKLSAKPGVVPNLFYRNMGGTILIKTPGYQGVIEEGSVRWNDNSSGVNNGFKLSLSNYDAKAKTYVFKTEQETGLTVVNGKPADADVAKGTLSFKLKGFQKTYTFDNFAIKYNYQKPALVTKDASTNVILSAGQNKGRFTVYSKTDKRNMVYSTAADSRSPFCYEEITLDRSDVVLETSESGEPIALTYHGGESNQKVTVKLTLSSRFWREDLTAVHTVKVIKPTAYLKYKQLTFHTAARGAIYNEVYMKDIDNTKYNITYADIEIKGANQESQKLLDEDRLIIVQDGRNYVNFAGGNAIKVEQGQDLGRNAIAPGSYSYKITPYYNKAGTNERTALNTLTLTIKVTNKPITAKVSPKGTIDLARANDLSDKKNQVVLVDPKFSNLSDGYEIDRYMLQGEYSQYFELKRGDITYGGKHATHYYIQPKQRTDHKLKAGQAYRLSIVYTLRLNYAYGFDGSVTVMSNTFVIRPKQTVPAIKVKNHNQALYAGAAGNQSGRKYYLTVPTGYGIDSLSGSIDCNKDGRADIEVSGFYYDSDRSSYYTVAKITDRDAVLTAANGKTYTIPVTVRCRGRDGISQDAKISIKVKIRR